MPATVRDPVGGEDVLGPSIDEGPARLHGRQRSGDADGHDGAEDFTPAAETGFSGVGVKPGKWRGHVDGQPGPTKSGSSSVGARIVATFVSPCAWISSCSSLGVSATRTTSSVDTSMATYLPGYRSRCQLRGTSP